MFSFYERMKTMKKKRTASIILSLLIAVSAAVAAAPLVCADTESDEPIIFYSQSDSRASDYAEPGATQYTSGDYKYEVVNGGCKIVKYTGSDSNLIIPNEIDGKAVLSIGDFSFYNCTSLTSVIIPEGVKSIGRSAFVYCSGLTSVNIPDGVTSIGICAFNECSCLTDVNIPNSVTSIGDSAFSYCPGLTSVTIPNSVTTIGKGAFSGCTGLTDISIGNNVSIIGAFAFSDCTSLISIDTADKNASFTSKDGVLYNKDMTSLIAFPGGKTSIIIPNSVKSIGSCAFSGCTGLTSISIVNNVTTIGEGAFAECTNLTSITIGNNVTTIGKGAFAECTGLTSINIPNSVTKIGSSAFNYCENLSRVTLSDKLESIEDETFSNCSNLSEITVPDSVTVIGESAFLDCSRLTSVTIGNGVEQIGRKAFYDCKCLEKLTLGNGVKIIEEYAFYGCPRFVSIIFPESITTICDYAFFTSNDLTTIYIRDSVTSIGNNSFQLHQSGKVYCPMGDNSTYLERNLQGYVNGMKVEKIECSLINGSFIEKSKVCAGNIVSIHARMLMYHDEKSQELWEFKCDGYQYAVFYKKSGETSWKKVQDYNDSKTISFTIPEIGKYTVRVKAKDKSGKIYNKDMVVSVNAAPQNTSTVSGVTMLGDNITVKCSGQSGVAPYTYAVYYKQASQTSWTKAQDYCTNNTVKITPKSATTYNIRVKLKDSLGNITNKDMTCTVNEKLVNSSKLSASAVELGKSVTVNCSGEGGNAPYTYAVYYRQESQTSWTKAQDCSTNPTITIILKSATTYNVRVKLKDSLGNIANKDMTYTVNKKLTNSSRLSASTVELGKSVTVNCSGEGGNAPYTYAVYYKQESQTSWTKAQDFSTNTTVKITPKSAKVYTVRVKLKDSSGKVVNKDITVTVKQALTNKSTISAEKVKVGNDITISCAGNSGTTPYTYAVYYKLSTYNSYRQLQDYSANTKVSFTPDAAGTYQFRVKLKDTSGKIVNKDFTVTAEPADDEGHDDDTDDDF